MQAPCRIDQHDVGTIGLRTLQGVESHRGRVRAHLLLHHGHAYTLAPDAKLLYGCCAECVGSTQIYLLACLLELPGELADGRGLAHAVHAHHKNHVGLMVAGQIPVVVILRIVLCQQICDFIAQDAVQLRGADILVARHALLDAPDDLQRRVDAHITRDKHFLEIVEHIVINLRLSGYRTGQFTENAGLGFLQALVERFLLILIKKSENSHNAFNYACKDNNFR